MEKKGIYSKFWALLDKMPVMGMSPMSMPMFSMIWKSHMPMTPATISEPSWLPAESPIHRALPSRARYRSKSSAEPAKPNCSAQTQKMKSVADSGKKPPEDWVALPQPLPVISPEPTAILACWRL